MEKNSLNRLYKLSAWMAAHITLLVVGVAQLVAFLVWDQAVAGSSPVTPTKVHQFVNWWIFCFT